MSAGVARGEASLDENIFLPPSGVHPVPRGRKAGDDIGAALVALCGGPVAPARRVWSIAPVPRKPR